MNFIRILLNAFIPRKWQKRDRFRGAAKIVGEVVPKSGKNLFVPGIYPPYGFIRKEDFAIMVATLYCECRSEHYKGQLAVAHTILNRSTKRKNFRAIWWGGNIYDVCKKPYQFSCWNDWEENNPKEHEEWKNKQRGLKLQEALLQEQYDDLNASAKLCVSICIEALQNSIDPTNGATHYYNPHTIKTPPKWTIGQTPVAIIGNHTFYKLEA